MYAPSKVCVHMKDYKHFALSSICDVIQVCQHIALKLSLYTLFCSDSLMLSYHTHMFSSGAMQPGFQSCCLKSLIEKRLVILGYDSTDKKVLAFAIYCTMWHYRFSKIGELVQPQTTSLLAVVWGLHLLKFFPNSGNFLLDNCKLLHLFQLEMRHSYTRKQTYKVKNADVISSTPPVQE